MGRIWDLIVSNASLDSNSSWINRRTPQLQPFKNVTTVALNKYVRHGWSPKKGDLQHSPGLPNYDSSSKFSQDQPGILLQQLQGLQGWNLGVQEASINFQAWANSHSPDMISWYLNREAPKRTGLSLLFIMHTWGLLTSFCSRNHEVISSSYLPNKIIVVHSIWLRDKSGCVTMDTSDCTFSKTIKSLGSNYEDMANGLLADSIEIEMYIYIYIFT